MMNNFASALMILLLTTGLTSLSLAQVISPTDNNEETTNSSTTTTPTPQTHVPATPSTPAEEQDKQTTFEQINALFGAPFFSDKELWIENAQEVIDRLKLRKESDTGDQSRFRNNNPGKILGITCKSIILSNRDAKPDNFLIMFTNKGDSLGMNPASYKDDRTDKKELKKAIDEWEEKNKNLSRQIKADSDEAEKKLESLFGAKRSTRFGQSGKLSEKAKQWTWNNHVFMLIEDKDDSLSLRIVTPETAEKRGAGEKISNTEIKKELKERVEHRPNGDVIITGIPMIDQGRKGYCVPSTWTRCLQYMGIPADEYSLANASGTKRGGGTYTADIVNAVSELVRKNQREIDRVSGTLSVRFIKDKIDKGIPIMWGMYSTEEFRTLSAKPNRMGNSSPEEYEKNLKEKRKFAKKLQSDSNSAHMCMIIGYNEKTDEISTTDSWGPQFAEEWFPIEAAARISQNEYYFIKP